MKTKLLLLIFTAEFLNEIVEAQRISLKPRQRQQDFQTDKLQYIPSLMGHMNEPVCLLKGRHRNIAFKVPKEYLEDRFQDIDLVDRSGVTGGVQEVEIKPIKPPDISIPMKLGRDENFSMFLPSHRKMAAQLIDVLMGMHGSEDFLSASVFCREKINPYLYIYALSVAMLHRQDTKNITLPTIVEIFPDKYVAGGIFPRARQEANAVPDGSRVPIEIPKDYTASDFEPEHRVSYFREDIGLNLNHWYFHLIYPFSGPRKIVNKDRRGELFYYFHQQIIARYNFERLSNNLGCVKKLNNWDEPLKEAYFPKLDNVLASRVWPAREKFTKLHDINREADRLSFDIDDMKRWRSRIFDAIHRGAAINDRGEYVPLTEEKGIDMLGNMVQSSSLSVNKNFYGDMHNLGHMMVAYCHDPDGRNLETFGVMADVATAMRDPVFYRWHSFINSVFQEHKNLLPRYTIQQLTFPGVNVSGIELITANSIKNEFTTFWQKSDVDLSRGLDFAPGGAVYARITHLQHAPYLFAVQVSNSGPPRTGTVRIFLAPKFNEQGRPMLFREQKNLFIEMDKFTVHLKTGLNVFWRESKKSSVTATVGSPLKNLNNSDPQSQEAGGYCSCGWPRHLMIPKGKPEGLPAHLFVMISDYAIDRVDQPPPEGCRASHSYCGLRDRMYPDKKPMGFPFDRMPRSGVNTLQEFLTPNMGVLDVMIRHYGKTAISLPLTRDDWEKFVGGSQYRV
ncbi:phenoloxidase 2-like isoform X2 [Schistocerca americana]|uniref:phenoloxidase 2-like isoform X2 n=1 Tax=Schistocerca americana TaxID=7009 RepID=UPI001F500915|nr:phenoloxidase 2-like isoform X2 [Schistocerca americana]